MNTFYSAVMGKYGEGAVAIIDARFTPSEKNHQIDEHNAVSNLINCINSSKISSLETILRM